MNRLPHLCIAALAACFLAAAAPAHAQCPDYQDFGDAPESVQAYTGVPGHFPTCRAPSSPGTQELAAGCPPLSTPPGQTGYVEHRRLPDSPWAFWLGCGSPTGGHPGIDSEFDGKTNDTGPHPSACNQSIMVDCTDAWLLAYGQDECYLDGTDAGIKSTIRFTGCRPGDVTFEAFNCGPNPVEVYLNILADWNHDGDWNDNFTCTAGCAHEWAVKNVPITLVPGCQTLTSPQFLAGPYAGPGFSIGWLRITLTERPVGDSFPWAGSEGEPENAFAAGETEDYAFEFRPSDDCDVYQDFGDAPEDVQAYAGIRGHFPTCITPSPAGTQEVLGVCVPLSTPPGPTGYVEHVRGPDDPYAFWLGCPGVDSEHDGKMNDTGAPVSACDQSVQVDCIEPWWLPFGQDECYGDGVDAGIQNPVTFTSCQAGDVTFDAFNCKQTTVGVFLNILVDWNHDGDWNDAFECPPLSCAYEWAVKNHAIALPPGCTTIISPKFLAGPFPAPLEEPLESWMRITLTKEPVRDDFPWAGSLGETGDVYRSGETEDYPVEILAGEDPEAYHDFGDAPEDVQAYLGVTGHFPTCTTPSPAGTQEIACTPPLSTPPGPTGYVEHVRNSSDPFGIWLGCWAPGVDGEHDGKMNDTGAPASACDPGVPADCQIAWWLTFGQDECRGDGVDAGIQNPTTFTSCTPGDVTFDAFNNGSTDVEAYLNILVDWNHDGDWNDNFDCPGVGCAYEWAVKNHPIMLPPGCTTLTSPKFLAGPLPGAAKREGWMRITITLVPVRDNFPWAGSVGEPGDVYETGETEDYPVTIEPGDPCEIAYVDFGDAPEDDSAYTSGIRGRFPTCLFPSPRGTQEIQCGAPRSTPPLVTGFVRHVALPTDPWHFWLGCGPAFPGGVDSEPDGKMDAYPIATLASHCDPNVFGDCAALAFGVMPFAQDECPGDGVDAGVTGPFAFPPCGITAVNFDATSCAPTEIEVFLNILVDWNYDADWNDNIVCPDGTCAYEWAVKNFPIVLQPGCNPYTSPQFVTGPNGVGWMRVTLTAEPVADDFPWAGSANAAGESFHGGETEDYPVVIPPYVGTEDPAAPQGLKLAPTWPNPGRDFTLVRYALPRETHVDLAVFDVSGRKVRTLAVGIQPAGEHTQRWDYRTDDGNVAPAGLYMVSLSAEGRVLTQRTIKID